MLLLIGALLAAFLAPSPWNAIGLAVGLVLWIGELLLWHRTVRHRRTQVGAETLIGRRGHVVTPCHPEGQVRLAGESEIWSARCAPGADPGAAVTIVGIDKLTLIVEPLVATGSANAGAIPSPD
jgi:membrane protein implicated in regulation of membrane protease activity